MSSAGLIRRTRSQAARAALPIAFLLLQGTAGAAVWSAQRVPPPTAPSARIVDMSCASRSACIAVGASIDSAGRTVPLAERWDGRRWSMTAVPAPAAAIGTGFYAVSCPTSSACTAVGGAAIGRWNGRRWAVQAAPRRTAGDLSGVSCWAARGCIAVGERRDGESAGEALAMRWSGRSWSIQRPASRGGEENALDEVSCTSARSCMAVGFSVTDSDGDTVSRVERWDGHRWSTENNPHAGFGDQLSAISCDSAESCTAVGSFYNRAYSVRPLVERWQRGRWSFELPARPAAAVDGSLGAVSCHTDRTCLAVGSFTARSGKTIPLIERLSGGRWSSRAAPGFLGALTAVSCVSATVCAALGETNDNRRIVSERMAATRWTRRSAPDPLGPLPSVLSSVSCASPTRCVAVGYFSASPGAPTTPLAEDWDGVRWSIETPPNPAKALGGQLTGVSCASRAECVAVGETNLSSDTRPTPFIEIRGAAGWKLDPARPPAESTLNGVSCPSAAVCVAVGSRAGHMLAEAWNGAGWTIHAVPDPAGASASQLNGVSCTSASRCVAVGYAQQQGVGSDATLAATWNGSEWTIQSTPNASSTQNGAVVVSDQLNAVACFSPTACTAVGINASHSLAERWDGSNWTIQKMPDADANGTNVPRSVACASATSCEAVGVFHPQDGSAASRPLSEGWSSGAWSLQPTPTDHIDQLSSVSCAGACMAVGSVIASQDFTEPFAEMFS